MDGELIIKSNALQLDATVKGLLRLNEKTAVYGLMLTDKQAIMLAEQRLEALKSNDRVEFGEGILTMLADAFCDSPYICQQNYADTLSELQNAFYYFKNEAEDRISDDELIGHMKTCFNEVAQGSMEYLCGTELEELCRHRRGGRE